MRFKIYLLLTRAYAEDVGHNGSVPRDVSRRWELVCERWGREDGHLRTHKNTQGKQEEGHHKESFA